jgi:hypothetical protein
VRAGIHSLVGLGSPKQLVMYLQHVTARENRTIQHAQLPQK